MKICFFYLLSISLIYAQTTIEGSVKNEQRQNIAGASVIIYDKSFKIIQFTTTDTLGSYFLRFSSPDSILQVEVRSWGYESIKQTLFNKNQKIHFTLQESVESIETIEVKGNPVVVKIV
jgi:hypothetical protein